MDNFFINRLMRSTVFYYFVMVLVTFLFWGAGLNQALNFQSAQADMAHFNLEPTAFFAAGSSAILIIGSLLMIFGKRYAWLGAGMLILYTLATIPIAHHFWTMQGEEKISEMHVAFEHITVVGGLFAAAVMAELRFGRAR